MPYIPRYNPRIISRMLPPRHKGALPRFRQLSVAPDPALESLIGDVFAGIETAVVRSVNEGVSVARTALVGTAKQEAAAVASKAITKALQKKKRPGTIPAPKAPAAALPAPATAPAAAPEAAPVSVPGKGSQVVYYQQEGNGLKQYLPYVGMAAGVVVLVVLIQRRK